MVLEHVVHFIVYNGSKAGPRERRLAHLRHLERLWRRNEDLKV